MVTDASQQISNTSLLVEEKEWKNLGVKTILSHDLIKDSSSGSAGVFASVVTLVGIMFVHVFIM